VSKPSEVSFFVLSRFISTPTEVTTAADDTLPINANGANGWGEFLAGLNQSLDPLDMEFSRMRNEVTGKEEYALVGVPSTIHTMSNSR
jgi:hypothetical protein